MMYGRVALAGFLLVVLLGSQTPARSQDNIQELRAKCNEAEKLVEGDPAANVGDAAYCIGFMAGAGTVLRLNCHEDAYAGRLSMASSTVGQRVRIFMNWANVHPEYGQSDESAAVLVLADGLPCKK